MSPKPIIHGRDHAPGGADPIPGFGAGGVTGLIANWTGLIPTVVSNGSVRRVPTDADETPLDFTLVMAYFRLEVAQASDTTVRLEKSPGGNFAFSATTIVTITVTTGDYEAVESISVAVESTDLIRIVYMDVPSATCQHEVQLLGAVA